MNKALTIKGNGICLTTMLKRLLSDVRVITGVSLRVPCENMDDWVLQEGPKIDKEMWQLIESYGRAEIEYLEKFRYDGWGLVVHDKFKSIPEWLLPLWDVFVCSDLHQLSIISGNIVIFDIDELDRRRPMRLRALKCLHQILVFGYKTELPHTNEQTRDVIETFIESDAACLVWRDAFERKQDPRLVGLVNDASKIVSRITAKCDFRHLVCRHGPGGVYPSRMPNAKSRFLTLYESILRYYCHAETFIGLPSFWGELMGFQGDVKLNGMESITAKVTAVPKDSRGPRLICVHPAEAIWIQLGQADVLCQAIESSPLTKGRISFSDQTVNGKLALSSSSDGAFCTLDLKEASDRIDSVLVKAIFGQYQYDILSCSRATEYITTNGKRMTMNKWAPMGNGLTFPVQSLLFFAIVVAGISRRYGVHCNDVYVFGDDIIFPTRYLDGAISALVRCGLVPNMTKTFHKGLFRESCGVEAYDGFIVTPVRVKKGVNNKACVDGVSLCDLAKRLRIAGYYQTATYVYEEVSRRFGKLPLSNNPEYSGIYEYDRVGFDYLLRRGRGTKWFPRLQVHGIEVRSVVGIENMQAQDEWFHLLDSLLRLGRREAFQVLPEEMVRQGEIKTPPSIDHSERRFTYPFPNRVRSCYGIIQHLWAV